MKIFNVCLFILLLSFQAIYADSTPKPGDQVFTVQVGAFRSIAVADFESLQGLGYVYTTATKTQNVSRVQVGMYSEKVDAEAVLAEVQAAGFPDAFVAAKTLQADNMVYLIQLAAYDYNDIRWEEVEPAGKLYAQLTENKIKVMAGVYGDLTAVNTRLNELRRKGYTDAFIKYINKDLIHLVGNFEKAMNKSSETERLGAVKVKGKSQNFNPKEAPEDYDIQGFAAATSRKSVLELQEALSEATDFDATNGYLDNATVVALENYTTSDERYAHYADRVKSHKQLTGTKKDALQNYIDMIVDNPTMAVNGLRNSGEPLAKAYTAYMLFTGKAEFPSANKSAVVNKLMNEAIRATYVDNKFRGVTTLDYNQSYDYQDVNTIIRHICYIQHASSNSATLPCWIFEEHSQEAVAILQELNLPLTTDCGDFMDWQEIKLVKEIASDLDPLPEYKKGEAALEELKAYRAKRAQLYLAPQPMKEMEAEIIELWHQKLWASMDAHGAKDITSNNIIRTFKVAYFKAMVKLENHYIGRGFTPDESRLFAISTLRTVVNYHISGYLVAD